MEELKLNIGAGGKELPGYIPIDRKLGSEAYPLAYEDGTVDEIRASHVLEHIPHQKVFEVIKHWVSKLKPGGCLKVAVPDFEKVSREYLDGKPINIQGYVMGGQQDEDDYHRSIFDREAIAELFVNCGLERLGLWTSEIDDCASLPISLNVMGFKPHPSTGRIEGVRAVLSTARFGPMLHMQSAAKAFGPLGIPYNICQGAYWHQVLCETIEKQLNEGAEYIITTDYDSVFTRQDVEELYRLIRAYGVDCVAAVQAGRGFDFALFGMKDDSGKPITQVHAAAFQRNLTKVSTAHFGLTIFKADALRSLPRPWMIPQPNADGRWADGRVDCDMDFWRRWADAGRGLYLANHIVIGHAMEIMLWPGRDFKPVYQSVTEYANVGIPPEVRR